MEREDAMVLPPLSSFAATVLVTACVKDKEQDILDCDLDVSARSLRRC
jgi:hypothetical protein